MHFKHTHTHVHLISDVSYEIQRFTHLFSCDVSKGDIFFIGNESCNRHFCTHPAFDLFLFTSDLGCSMAQGARDPVGTVVAIVTDSVCEDGPISTSVEHP